MLHHRLVMANRLCLEVTDETNQGTVGNLEVRQSVGAFQLGPADFS